MKREITVNMPEDGYISWFVTTQNTLKTKVQLNDANGKPIFTAEKVDYHNKSIDPPLALGAASIKEGKLPLIVDVNSPVCKELKGKPVLFEITDDNGNLVGKSFSIAMEDYTDDDYNDIYVNIVGWTQKA